MSSIRIKINVTRLDKAHIFEGKNGKYVDLILWKNDQPDQYGNDFTIQQDIPREARESGKKGAYCGSGKSMEPRQTTPTPRDRGRGDNERNQEDDIPF